MVFKRVETKTSNLLMKTIMADEILKCISGMSFHSGLYQGLFFSFFSSLSTVYNNINFVSL